MPAAKLPKWAPIVVVIIMAAVGAFLGIWLKPSMENIIPPDLNWILILNMVLGIIAMISLVVGGWLLARAIDRRKI